ncbi:hypothetical protein [Sedimentitalea todarodis]|uniref:Uncharacterized protein n=1 Tax=Sedimentitalea todarodis TaxID=1631240 RepID=A0ABU3V7S9_9RHOB|nr:hypothetical protein [Sedimentitalea todarodis]MDU9002226.1 hypothetical protein [Sedimentitalea todarodis]
MPVTNSLDSNILFVGHSLVNHDLPAMLRGFVSQTGGTGSVQEHIINGSPLWWSWENADRAELPGFGVNAREELPQGQTDVLILTEGVPHPSFAEAVEGASNFYNLAISANPDTQVYMYETWHDLRSGTPGFDVEYDPEDDIPWRERIDHALPQWQAIVDAVNDQRAPDAPEMLLIPVGQVMGRLYDEIAAGNVPGISDIRELFIDDIHLNDLGLYLVAIVQYTTVFGQRPDDVELQQYGQWGEAFDAPSAELAAFMKDIAWDVAMGDADGETIHGGTGNDILAGGEGDDTFNGGDGTDEVQLDGAWDEFEFSFDSTLKIADTNTTSGVNEGVDTLIGIEVVTFSDGTFADVTVGVDNVIVTFFTEMDVHFARTVLDSGNSRDWSSYMHIFDADGVTETGRTTIFDDGRLLEIDFEATGIRLSQALTDIADDYSWDSKTTTFGADGTTKIDRITTYDDGRLFEIDYDAAGVRLSQTVMDTADVYVWNERTTTFGADGIIKTDRITTYDDGRVLDVDYNDAGIRTTQTMTDATDVYVWESYNQTFDADGNLLGTTYIDDTPLV